MKKRLTESNLHKIINNSINRILKEEYDNNIRNRNIKIETAFRKFKTIFNKKFEDLDYYTPPLVKDLKFKLDSNGMKNSGSIFTIKIFLNMFKYGLKEIGEIRKEGYKGGYIGYINNTKLENSNTIIDSFSFYGETLEDLIDDLFEKCYYCCDDDDNYANDSNMYESKNILRNIIKESIKKVIKK